MSGSEHALKKLLVCITDFLGVIIAGSLSIYLAGNHISYLHIYLFILSHIVAFYISNQFSRIFRRDYKDELKAVLHYSGYLLVVLILMKFIFEDSMPFFRTEILLFVPLNAVFIYIQHCFVKLFYIKSLNQRKKLLIATTSDRLDTIFDTMINQPFPIGEVIGVVLLDRVKPVEVPITKQNIPILFHDDFEAFAMKNVVDEAFIYLSKDYDDLVPEYILILQSMGILVSINISGFELNLPGDRRIRRLGDYSVLTFSSKFYSYPSIVLKRTMDIIGALVGLLITAVVSIFLVPAIKLNSPGPAIFSQNRVGKNGRVFKFYKFRSMYADAEARKKELEQFNTMQGGMFKMEDDPRITPVGKFIRKTSLDELPQFYNVLIGDMSLIGTRPPTEDEYLQYSPFHKQRLKFKPGITGLWQVSGRSDITDFEEVVRLDVEYIDNWSLWSDIKILLKTIKIVLLGKGAK